MGFQNRKMFLSNEDIPFTPLNQTIQSPPPEPTPAAAIRRPLHLRPIFSSDVAYSFLIVFSALFFITFLLLTFREFFLRRRDEDPPCQVEEPAARKTLQVCVYGSREASGAADCAVCLEEFKVGETVNVTPNCGHVFHPLCIDTWLTNHVTCPVCRCARIFRLAVVDGGSTAEDGGAGGEVG